MDYYSIFNLCREPFSNSPDPEYFFKSRQHFSCLQKIELALRLRRGLNVIIGEVGTGKTTLCRQLLLRLSKDAEMETHLILDPSFDTPTEFLARVVQMLSGNSAPANSDQWQLKERIKHHLFRKGIEEEKIVSLIIDEGQKIPPFCIEILREFLNYETNQFKLLQIVLFAQQEFVQLLVEHANFSDRVNFFTTLAPLSFQDTRRLIEYRIKQSSNTDAAPTLFTLPAYWAIHRISKGHPRKIIHLCHQSMLAMIIQNRRKIGRKLVLSCARRTIPSAEKRFSLQRGFTAIIVSVAVVTVIFSGIFYKALFTPVSENSIQPAASAISHHPIPSTTSSRQKRHLPKDLSLNRNSYATKSLKPAPIAEKPMNSRISDSSGPNPMPPFILGTLRVKDGENLTQLINWVHGDSSSDYIEAVLTLNPHFVDPSEVSTGTDIQFPALAVTPTFAQRNVYRIELSNNATLIKAREDFFSDWQKYKNIFMVAYWNPDRGLRFSIFIKKIFDDMPSAEKLLHSIPPLLARKAEIATDWNKETLFFTDPSPALIGNKIDK